MIKRVVGGRLYGLVTSGGWSRWVALAAAAFLFMLSVLFLARTTDYRDDPSALVPRSAEAYAETRNLPELLKTAGAWRLWRDEKRSAGGEAASALETALAAMVSARVDGLPVNPPLRWLSVSTGAAWCLSRDAAEDEAGEESWALYLRVGDPAFALKEMEVEPGMKLEVVQGAREGDGVFSLAGRDGKVAYVGVVGPWLILSGDAKLPEFALEARRAPSVSLSRAGILPNWRRGAGLRGVFNPSTAEAGGKAFGTDLLTDWLSPTARIACTAFFGRSGGVEAQFNTVELNKDAVGGGWWMLLLAIAVIVALCSFAVILAVLLVMIGWGGWLKAMAARAGIAPETAPEEVTPSAAFTEDSNG